MIGWLSLTDEQRRATLEQASLRSGIQAKAIEKDWWVTLCLKALFNTPYAKYCIFKGGTSLSKGWKLIRRLSEDIDIALDPQAFGMEYKKEPSHSYVKQLKRAGCEFTSTKMKEALIASLRELNIADGTVEVYEEPILSNMPDKDPQTIFVKYTSLYDPHPYLADDVKMEFGVRSLKEPYNTINVQTLLNEYFPLEIYDESGFEVVAVDPQKTLLEKAFLIHEKLLQNSDQLYQDERQSRHLSDLVQSIDTNRVSEILSNAELYNAIVEHRRHYVRLPGINYDSLHPHILNFVPPVELMDYFRRDYEKMQEAMIYGESDPFDELMQKIKLLNGRFRLMGTGLVLEDVISNAVELNRNLLRVDVNIVKLPIQINLGGEQQINFTVTMHKVKDGFRFENIGFNQNE